MSSAQSFEWDPRKNEINWEKHGIRFDVAQKAFFDRNRVIAIDTRHSTRVERRMFCYGKTGDDIITVRFVIRHGIIRIFRAGFWREGRRKYEKANGLQQSAT